MYECMYITKDPYSLFVGVDGCYRGMAALHAWKYTCGQSPEAHVDNLSIIRVSIIDKITYCQINFKKEPPTKE